MRTPIIASLFLFAAPMAQAHPGDLNRCVDAQGHAVFTDKPCEELGATARAPTPTPVDPMAPGRPHVHVHDCAGDMKELKDGLEGALVAADVNRVAAFYYWPGTSGAESEGILKRLQAIVARPFVSVNVLHGAVEITQTHSTSDPTPVSTVLPVSSYMGCLWVRL
jgi:hypothetical protein